MTNNIVTQPDVTHHTAPHSPPQRPQALPVHFDAIPPELADAERFVVWRYRWVKEKGKWKWKKPLYSALTGKQIGTNDPAQLAPMEQAQAAYTRGRWDGIGRVTTADDRLTGIDLDDCIDAAGNVAAWARAIVEELDSYTEVSPSGEGLRIFVLGEPPPNGKRRGNVEIYDRKQYLTITGHHLPGTPTTIEARQSALERVHAAHIAPPAPTPAPAPRAPHRATHSAPASDDDILAKALGAPNRAKFARLWNGDTSGHGDDHSAADMALCNMLAYWSDCNAGAMDRLFRQSALYRPEKWDKVHYSSGATYGQKTIEEAIDGTPRRKVDAASALPADRDLAARVATLEAENAQLRAENAQLRAEREAERETMRRVLRQPGYLASRRVLLANVILDAEPDPEIDGWQRLDHATRDKLAERYGMGAGTVQTGLQQFEKGGIVERQYLKRYTDDRGHALAHPLTEDTILRLRIPEQLELDELPAVARTEAARNNAAEVRKLAQQARQAACPECGETGLTLACHHCGCVIEADDDPDREEQSLPTAREEQTLPPVVDTVSKLCLSRSNDVSTVSTGGGGSSPHPG